jgi:hypothetical protein
LSGSSTKSYIGLQEKAKRVGEKIDEVNKRAEMAVEQAKTLFSDEHKLITYDTLCSVEKGESFDLDGIVAKRLKVDGCVFESYWLRDTSTRIHFHDFVEHLKVLKGRLWINGLEIIDEFSIATSQEHILTGERGTLIRVTLNEPA